MPTASTKPLQQINIHLLKSTVLTPKSAIAKGKSLSTISTSSTVLPGGVLFYESKPARPAGWRSFLEPAFSSALPQFNSPHASAVLFFEAGAGKLQRQFALTFGYGRALLDEAALEADFGLRSALQLCDPATLRAVNYRTIEDRTRFGRIQLSDAGSVDAFHMNVDTDLLRGLEAESNDPSVCERLGARWSNLILAARIDISGLKKLASDVLACYRKRKLPGEYTWIDNVRRINDSILAAELDAALESLVNTAKLDGIRLAIPDIEGPTSGIEAKLFTSGVDATSFTSSFAGYLNARPRQADWKTSTAKTAHKVYLINSATGAEIQHTSLYRCIVAELDYKTDRYLLVDGEWFRLDRNFVAEINTALARIPVLSPALPAWITDEAEGDWNLRACNQSGGVLLDKANIPYGGGRSKIEPADILSKDKVFLHVKRLDRSSSGLSHLFAQGTVASRLLSQDEEFRKKVASHVSDKKLARALTKPSFNTENWTVGYVILGADANSPTGSLPFFSKVNLKGAAEQLRLMGYRIGIAGI